MDNVFVKIIEANALKDEEAIALFKCSKEELKDIKKGVKKPSTEGMYAITKRFGVSLDYLMTGKPHMIGDRRMEFLYQKKLTKDQAQINQIEYEEFFLAKDIKVTKAMLEAFDRETKTVNAFKIIKLNNFQVVDALASSDYLVSGGYKQSPFKESETENLVKNWLDIKKACGRLYLSGQLNDDGFAEYALIEDSYKNSRLILREISNGTRKWNPELILKLIKLGACVTKVASIFNGELVFEDDFISTKLLEKLCKEEINAK